MTVTPPDQSKERTAIHEAGHAVLFAHYGLSFVRVKLSDAGLTLGEVEATPVLESDLPTDADQRASICWQHIVCSWGGYVAEELFAEKLGGPADTYGAETDMANVREWTRRSLPAGTPEDKKQLAQFGRSETERIVRQLRPAVREIADRLLSVGKALPTWIRSVVRQHARSSDLTRVQQT